MDGWRVKVDGQMEGLMDEGMDGWMDACMGRDGFMERHLSLPAAGL